MTAFFRPVISVMNRLTYPRKFLLISCLFAVPLAWILIQFNLSIDFNSSFAQKELSGTTYLRPLHSMLRHVQQEKLWTLELVNGVVSRSEDITRSQALIETDLSALAAVDTQFGSTFETQAAAQKLHTDWNTLNKLPPAQRLEHYESVLDDIVGVIALVGDNSNLILDPNLDSSYTTSIILVNLPDQQEHIQEVMTLAEPVLAGGELEPNDSQELSRILAHLEDNLIEINRAMAISFRHNPAQNLEPVLQPSLTALAEANDNFIKAVDQYIIDAATPTPDAALLRAPAQQALQTSYDLWGAAVVQLDQILQRRIDSYTTTKYVILIITMLALLVVTYCWISFYQAVMQTVRRLAGAAERMVSGDLTAPVTLDNQDELGAVIRAFNDVAAALVQARAAQQQMTVAELRAAAVQLSSAAEKQQAITTHTQQVAAQVLAAFQVLDRAAIAITTDAVAVEEQAQALKEQNQRGNGAIVAIRQILTEMQRTALMLEHGAEALAEDARLASTLVEEAHEVAATTQLLSLNATIEAAGAGHYGARFGIIADEVRTLAGSAARAAQTISTALQRIAAETTTTASGTHQTRLSIDDGAAQVQVLHALMQSLLDSAEGLVENAEHIRERSEEQRSRSAEVHEGSRQLASIIEQLTGASQNVAAQAQGLLHLAQVLDTAVT